MSLTWSIDVEKLHKLAARDVQPDGPDLDPRFLACDNGEDPVEQCDRKGCELVCKAPLLQICADSSQVRRGREVAAVFGEVWKARFGFRVLDISGLLALGLFMADLILNTQEFQHSEKYVKYTLGMNRFSNLAFGCIMKSMGFGRGQM